MMEGSCALLILARNFRDIINFALENGSVFALGVLKVVVSKWGAS